MRRALNPSPKGEGGRRPGEGCVVDCGSNDNAGSPSAAPLIRPPGTFSLWEKGFFTRFALAGLLLCATAACTLDHEIGMVSTGGSGPGVCGSGGGGGGAGSSPIQKCQFNSGPPCSSPDEHCVEVPHDTCPGGACQGWCVATQTPAAVVCSGATNMGCATGMACVADPYLGCEPALICCQGVCFGVNLAPIGQAVAACGTQACAAPEHCVSDPAATCEFDGGAECEGVCVEAAQSSAIGCGAYPDFACAAGLHCLKNPNHDCTLPLDCPGLCVPD